ncbi:MAG: zf-TFIIB domain-containing protein [Candidatus Staskawiczbacteria bacterium]|nr:zf-TFIIB domain-containing protein [Candidatus Staskawiczbacteria bacterium]
MECPNNHGELEKALFNNVEVDYCPICLGIWFEQDELREAKDEKDKQLNWLDVDLWRDKGSFQISKTRKICPSCKMLLYEVSYDDSKTKVDLCNLCKGIWLDRGEFKQIIIYLKTKADYEILHNYSKNIRQELWEVFAGPEKFREELADFFTLLKLFNYKFVVQHPFLTSLIENMQK